MLHHRPLAAVLPFTFALAVLGAAGCPAAQTKSGGGDETEVVLRRIDVTSGTYEALQLNVVVAIRNPSGGDVDVDATARLQVVGESAGQAGEGAEEEDEAEGEEDADAPASPMEEAVAEQEAPSSSSSFAQSAEGRGKGSAVAFKESELMIPVSLPLGDASALETLFGWDKMLVEVNGTANVGGKRVTFGGKREVAPPRLPTVVLQEAQVASVDGGTSGAGFFKVGIDNKNPFDVTVDRFAWAITIADKELKPAGDGERDSVPASSVSVFEATVDINEATFGAKPLKAMLGSARVPYEVKGFMEVRGVRKDFEFKGDMAFAR